jgi:hypothetical protein
MNRVRLFYFLLFIFIAGQVSAQQILTIGEKDRDGNYRDKDNPGQIRAEYIDNRIADINSILEIKIDMASVYNKAGEFYNEPLPQELSGKISKILLALEQRNSSLERIDEIVKSYDYSYFRSDSLAYDNYIASLAVEAQALNAILNIDKRIKDEYFRLTGAEDLYSGVYQAASNVLPELENEFEKFAQESGIYIQFGGWLVTKHQNVPIHLEGFDDITPQAPFEVDRWQFIPTAEQLKELNDLQQLAKENRDLGLSILRTIAQNQVIAIKAFGELKFKALNYKLGTELMKLEETAASITTPEFHLLINSIAGLQNGLEIFSEEITARMKYYEGLTDLKDIEIKEFLVHAEADIDFILNENGPWLKKIIKEIETNFTNLKPAHQELADSIRTRFELLRNEFTSNFRAFEASARKKASEIIYGVELDEAAFKFGEDVYKLTLSDIPEAAELDLVNTGVRSDGDRLVLKLVMTDKGSPYQKTLETREIYLFRVLPHVITTVGVVFADPLARTEIQAQFQMAPSFNLLFKGLGDQKCRRRSVAYNRMFDWGLGLHLAAPDFDKDDVPEIAAGVVVSTLHDYLQGGFAFNIFTGDPYWFFGLRFPIPSFNIGASSQVQVE